MTGLRRLMVLAFGLAAVPCGELIAEPLTVDIQVKTSHENNSRTGNKVYFSLLHRKGRNSKPKFVTAELRNAKKRNFTAGAISKFQVKLDCSLRDVYAFGLSVGNSDDAWSCEGIKFQITRGGQRSQVISQPIPRSQRWFSAAANDGGKKARAKQFRIFSMPKPKLSVRNPRLNAN